MDEWLADLRLSLHYSHIHVHIQVPWGGQWRQLSVLLPTAARSRTWMWIWSRSWTLAKCSNGVGCHLSGSRPQNSCTHFFVGACCWCWCWCFFVACPLDAIIRAMRGAKEPQAPGPNPDPIPTHPIRSRSVRTTTGPGFCCFFFRRFR